MPSEKTARMARILREKKWISSQICVALPKRRCFRIELRLGSSYGQRVSVQVVPYNYSANG